MNHRRDAGLAGLEWSTVQLEWRGGNRVFLPVFVFGLGFGSDAAYAALVV